MATGKVHDEHIANILGKEFSLKRPDLRRPPLEFTPRLFDRCPTIP